MLTPEEVEKFADWIIKQEKKMMDLKYPLPKDEKELDKKTNEELLRELGV